MKVCTAINCMTQSHTHHQPYLSSTSISLNIFKRRSVQILIAIILAHVNNNNSSSSSNHCAPLAGGVSRRQTDARVGSSLGLSGRRACKSSSAITTHAPKQYFSQHRRHQSRDRQTNDFCESGRTALLSGYERLPATTDMFTMWTSAARF